LAAKCGFQRDNKYHITNVSHNTNQRNPTINYATLSVVTDRTIHNNRPDILIPDKSIKEAYLIEIRKNHKYFF